jgi:hypothetical protein
MITEPQPRLSWGYSPPSSQTGCPMITEPQPRLSWGYSLPSSQTGVPHDHRAAAKVIVGLLPTQQPNRGAP